MLLVDHYIRTKADQDFFDEWHAEEAAVAAGVAKARRIEETSTIADKPEAEESPIVSAVTAWLDSPEGEDRLIEEIWSEPSAYFAEAA